MHLQCTKGMRYRLQEPNRTERSCTALMHHKLQENYLKHPEIKLVSELN